ncbi:MAG: flagellar biosynthesis protein FliR [Synergistaceae bacterium]|jgi:H+/Cl- antiporter ClcA|nr:flagellar biosynthesis protein FliR [Synergistaceae bacterium]
MKISPVNLQAIIAIGFFIAAIGVSRAVVNIYSDKWKSTGVMTVYLRALLGFLLAGAIVLGYYSFAGIDVISGRW